MEVCVSKSLSDEWPKKYRMVMNIHWYYVFALDVSYMLVWTSKHFHGCGWARLKLCPLDIFMLIETLLSYCFVFIVKTLDSDTISSSASERTKYKNKNMLSYSSISVIVIPPPCRFTMDLHMHFHIWNINIHIELDHLKRIIH